MTEKQGEFFLFKVMMELEGSAYFNEVDLPDFMLFGWKDWKSEDREWSSKTKTGRYIAILLFVQKEIAERVGLENGELLSEIRGRVEENLLQERRIRKHKSFLLPEIEPLYLTTTRKTGSEDDVFIIGPRPDEFSDILASVAKMSIGTSERISGSMAEIEDIVKKADKNSKIPRMIFSIPILHIPMRLPLEDDPQYDLYPV